MNSGAYELVRRSVEEHALSDDERLLERLRITQDKELPPMRFLFRIFGKPCFPRGELVAVTGKAKSGKTLFNSLLMACCIRGERCLWYDTEQSEQSTQDILKNRLLPMSRLPGSDIPISLEKTAEEDTLAAEETACPPPEALMLQHLDVFNVRCLKYEERLRLFITAVQKYRPALVVLDGVRDLLADINDGVRAQEVVEQLMKLAQQTGCCLVCVLHQNKGAEDRNLRGWIGTELMNKAFEVYACEKVKPENIFVVEQTHTRKYDLGEMLFFRMDEATALPVACAAPTRYVAGGFAAANGYSPTLLPGDRLPPMNRAYLTFDENNRPHPKTEELFYEALKAGPLYYTDLQAKVRQLLNCGTQMWNNMFCKMRDTGTIVRLKNAHGKPIWQWGSQATAAAVQTEFFDWDAADLGDSPSSKTPI